MSTAPTTVSEVSLGQGASQRFRRRSFWAFLRRLAREKPLGAFGGVLMLFMALVAVFADVIATGSPYVMRPTFQVLPPSGEFFMGTDQFGRDIFSRVVHGARVSMTVGLSVVIFGTGLATILGAASGFVGGKIDTALQRVVDAVMAIPSLILLLTIMAMLGPGLLNVILALSFRDAVTQSRIVRGAVIGIREHQYVEAAQALGASPFHVLTRHVMPNVFGPVMVVATITLGSAVLAEASLSFLGYGVPQPIPSWGGMLSREGRAFLTMAPWMAIFPGLALSLAVFGINMLGDALRDILDPRLRGSSGRIR